MTPARARTLATRWFITATVLLVARTALAMVGIDLIATPLTGGMWLALICSAKHSGWANGHETRDRALTNQENA